MSKAKPPGQGGDNADQLALDLEDAQLRLDRLRSAVLERDRLRDEVARLGRELKQAQRKLKEQGWTVEGLLRSEERRQPKGDQ